ncbi:MAG: hypothetical protein QOH73_2543 [Gaiellaceae bacterium]|nr:hypothetical protein [Gaiellaceae bacterium]
MLFLLFGSSAAGKSYVLARLGGRVRALAIHDFDEIGVPAGADATWRQGANEEWVQRAIAYEWAGTDLLLAGQTPVGELLRTPSVGLLDGVSACLMDCDDDTRITRLHARGPEWLASTGGTLQDYLNWAAWLRDHAVEQNAHVIDGAAPVDEVADALVEWIRTERARATPRRPASA